MASPATNVLLSTTCRVPSHYYKSTFLIGVLSFSPTFTIMPSILFWDNAIRSRRTSTTSSPSSSCTQSPAPSVHTPSRRTIVCNEQLLHSVLARMDQLSIEEDDDSLWALAKDLKRQQEEDEDQERPHKVEACYNRVIRIMLYYTRAQATLHAFKYYKKCMDVSLPCCGPTHVRALAEHFRDLAAKGLEEEEEKQQDPTNPSKKMSARSMSVSSYRSSSSSQSGSSFNSTSSATCARCGVEKRAMPVCAKCKAQAYCSIRCLKAHQTVHQESCRSTTSPQW